MCPAPAKPGGLYKRALDVLGPKCFAAGTPLLTPGGWERIEDVRVGDLVLARQEGDEFGDPEPKAVEEVFEVAGATLTLTVSGRAVVTTPEHPFFVLGRGWTIAAGHIHFRAFQTPAQEPERRPGPTPQFSPLGVGGRIPEDLPGVARAGHSPGCCTGERAVGWEARGGRAYYYRGRRAGGRVIKEYLGAGLIADLAAEVDALARDRRLAEAAAVRRAAADLAALDMALAPLDELADLVARAALLAAGCHRPHRGPWRKRRARPAQDAPAQHADGPGQA